METGGLMSGDVFVMSEAGVKLYCHILAETLLKFKRCHLVLTISCRQVMSPANPVI